MLKFISTSLLFLLALTSKAQGNLQFNRAETITLSKAFAANTPNGVYADSVILVVPQGKVFKLESVNRSGSSLINGLPAVANFYSCNIMLNGMPITTAFDNLSGAAITTTFPIWLKPGNYTFMILVNLYFNVPNPIYYKGMVTGVEFNVVP